MRPAALNQDRAVQYLIGQLLAGHREVLPVLTGTTGLSPEQINLHLVAVADACETKFRIPGHYCAG